MKNLSLLFIAFLFLNLTTFAQSRWTQKADIPTARSFLSSCTLDGKIYVIGGTESTSASGPSVGTMEVYDPILDSWDTTKAPMPTSRVEFGACAVNGKIYAIGGTPFHIGSALGTVEEYDPLTNTWDTNKNSMPTPRLGCAYGVIDNKIYVAGGDDDLTISKILEIYDPLTDTWDTTKAPMLIPIYQAQGAVINDTFYVIGGLLGPPPYTGQKIVQMYDPITNTWSRVADLIFGRVGHTANGIADTIYAIGGDTNPPPIIWVENYDANSNIWHQIDSAPFVKMLHTASVFKNTIYLFSGSTTPVPALTPSSTVYSFDPSYFQDTIHIPTDYPTIQEGIDSSGNGDIVLVAEDTYYENINYKGKAITVASHFLIDGNESHIANTIIDGSQPSHPDTGAVVNFVNQEDTTSVLCGFTITGGTGTHHHIYNNRMGGGIVLLESGGKVTNNIIEYNTIIDDGTATGGGIMVGSLITPPLYNCIIEDNIIRHNSVDGGWNSSAGGILAEIYGNVWIIDNQITNNIVNEGGAGYRTVGGGLLLIGWDSTSNYFVQGNTIANNTVEPQTEGYGGGVGIINCNAMLTNNIIVNNSAPEGGGISCDENSNPTITDATIEDNTATDGNGGGLFAINSNIQIDSCIFNSNETLGGRGGGIFMEDCDLQVDNCEFTYNEAFGSGGVIKAFNCEVQIENSLFVGNVSVNGRGGGINAQNSYLQIDNCFFEENESTTSSGGGIYFRADTLYNGMPFHLELKSSQFHNNLASSQGAGVRITNYYVDTLAINATIDSCDFIENSANVRAGVSIHRSSFNVSNSIFKGNTAIQFAAGAGFSLYSVGTVWNCLFVSNVANTGGGSWNSGGASVWSWSIVDFMNCTFADNSASYGAGLTLARGSVVTTTNCIFWGNSDDQIALDTYDNEGGTLFVNYCDLQGGEDSVNVIDSLSTLNWGIGNTDTDPLFVNSGIGDYHLQDTSPCISAAIDSIEISGLWYYCPVTDIEGIPRPSPAGTIPDMGAYESELAVGVEENESGQPSEYALSQNYPNPFNPTTKISFQIPELSFVTLKVYDVLGKEITTLINEEKQAGYYDIEFDASRFSSGVYFYKIQAGSFAVTKKMILMK